MIGKIKTLWDNRPQIKNASWTSYDGGLTLTLGFSWHNNGVKSENVQIYCGPWIYWFELWYPNQSLTWWRKQCRK